MTDNIIVSINTLSHSILIYNFYFLQLKQFLQLLQFLKLKINKNFNNV